METYVYTPSEDDVVVRNTPQVNNVAMIYYLAESFTNLSYINRYNIGRAMNILTEEDAMLPVDDMDDLVFDAVCEHARYVELMRYIQEVWHE